MHGRKKTRIELTDTIIGAIVKMSDQNPGAISALMALVAEAAEVDPQAFGGGYSVLLSLDSEGVYGSHIYILHNEKCGGDCRKTIMLLRACQLGFIPQSRIRELAADDSGMVNVSVEEWQDIEEKVLGMLSEFKK